MEVPEPKPGMVIRYSYLWRDEAMRGRDEGVKDRPCAIVLAVKRGPRTRVVLAPITHTPPEPDSGAVELPAQTAKRIGLDEEPQWIVTREVNSFTWPGPDIRPVSEGGPWLFGQLPYGLAKQAIERVREHYLEKRLDRVERDEEWEPEE